MGAGSPVLQTAGAKNANATDHNVVVSFASSTKTTSTAWLIVAQAAPSDPSFTTPAFGWTLVGQKNGHNASSTNWVHVAIYVNTCDGSNMSVSLTSSVADGLAAVLVESDTPYPTAPVAFTGLDDPLNGPPVAGGFGWGGVSFDNNAAGSSSFGSDTYSPWQTGPFATAVYGNPYTLGFTRALGTVPGIVDSGVVLTQVGGVVTNSELFVGWGAFGASTPIVGPTASNASFDFNVKDNNAIDPTGGIATTQIGCLAPMGARSKDVITLPADTLSGAASLTITDPATLAETVTLVTGYAMGTDTLVSSDTFAGATVFTTTDAAVTLAESVTYAASKTRTDDPVTLLESATYFASKTRTDDPVTLTETATYFASKTRNDDPATVQDYWAGIWCDLLDVSGESLALTSQKFRTDQLTGADAIGWTNGPPSVKAAIRTHAQTGPVVPNASPAPPYHITVTLGTACVAGDVILLFVSQQSQTQSVSSPFTMPSPTTAAANSFRSDGTTGQVYINTQLAVGTAAGGETTFQVNTTDIADIMTASVVVVSGASYLTGGNAATGSNAAGAINPESVALAHTAAQDAYDVIVAAFAALNTTTPSFTAGTLTSSTGEPSLAMTVLDHGDSQGPNGHNAVEWALTTNWTVPRTDTVTAGLANPTAWGAQIAAVQSNVTHYLGGTSDFIDWAPVADPQTATFTANLTLTDQASETETGTFAIGGLTVTTVDVGILSESAQYLAANALTDVPLSPTDSATVVDTGIVSATDTLTAAETLTEAAATAATDAETLTEVPAYQANLSATDALTVSDSATAQSYPSITTIDSLAGQEAATYVASTSATDQGTLAETQADLAFSTYTDLLNGTEALTNVSSPAISLQDGVAITDSLTTAASTSTTEGNTASETIAAQAFTSYTDLLTFTDAYVPPLIVVDSALGGVETIALFGALTYADILNGTDAFSHSDSGTSYMVAAAKSRSMKLPAYSRSMVLTSRSRDMTTNPTTRK